MANTIRLKKRASGGAAGAPSILAPAEPAFSEVDSILYYGFGDAGGGAASSIIAIGGSGAFATLTSAQTISGDKTFVGTVDLSSATLSGNTTFSNDLVVSGDLTVAGTTTTVNSTQVDVADKNLTLGNVSTPSDATADGGGISLRGATDKLFRWIDATDSWTSSENIDLATGKDFAIGGTSVLNASTLGSGVTGSSLTSVGTLTTGTWAASTISLDKGGTGATSAAAARTNLGVAIGSDVQPYNSDLNIVDGSTAATATTLAATDKLVANDGGTMVQVALSDLVTFLENGAVSGFDIDGGTY
jgi:hypothetical protein